MMKRIIAFILCAVLCVGLCSCKTGIEPIGDQGGTGETAVTEPAADPNVIFENELVKQTVVTKGMDSYGDYSIGTVVENKSDVSLDIEWSGCTINGWKMDYWELETVEPGQSVMVEIDIWESELEQYGIESVDQVDLYISMVESDDWDAEAVVAFVTYYPNGAENAPQITKREAKDEDIILVDESDILMLVDSIDPLDEDGYALRIYVENNSEQAVTYSVENIYADKWAMSTFGLSGTILPGAAGYDEMVLDTDMMELCQVTEPVELQMNINCYDSVSYDDILDETVAIYPSGLTAEDVAPADRVTLGAENVVIDNEYMTLTTILCEYDDIYGLVFTAYIENKTDEALTIDIDEISWADGLDNVFWVVELPAGTRGYFDIDTAEISDWENYDEFELRCRVYGEDGYGDPLVFDRVTFVAK